MAQRLLLVPLPALPWTRHPSLTLLLVLLLLLLLHLLFHLRLLLLLLLRP